ncbi:Calx-beta domain-containing protein [Halomonas denitrificans]|nr:hypothetical protein [Halomonas denitrificans]
MNAARTFLALASLVPAPAFSSTPLEEIYLSSDIHTNVPGAGGGDSIASDDAITIHRNSTGISDSVLFLGALDRSDVDAFHAADACGPALFSVSSTVEIGGVVMRPADVFQSDGGKALDALAVQVADGVGLDAVSRVPGTCDLVVSFDATVELDGAVFRPDDLVRFAGGVFNLFRAGPGSGNIDAVHVLDTGSVLASFSSPTPALGFAFSDQDIVEQTAAGRPWSLAFEPAAIDASWEPADTDAVFAVRAPIPGDLRWSRADIDVLEGQGSVNLIIDRVGPNEGPVSVSWTTVDGTATSGIDFGGASGSAAFSDGQASGTVPITLFDDGVVDGDKVFFVDLVQASNGAQVINPSRVTVRIRDDEDFLFADGFES